MDEDEDRAVVDEDHPDEEDYEAEAALDDVADWELDGALVADLLQANSPKSSYSLADFADGWCKRAERSPQLEQQLSDAASIIEFVIWAISTDGSAEILRWVSDTRAMAFDEDSKPARFEHCLRVLEDEKRRVTADSIFDFGPDERLAERIHTKLLHIFPDDLKELTIPVVADVVGCWLEPGSTIQATGVLGRLAFSVRAFEYTSVEQAKKNISEAVRKHRSPTGMLARYGRK